MPAPLERSRAARPRRQRRPARAVVVCVGLLVLAAGAGCEPDPRNDAVLFLDRIARVDADDPVAARRRMVESLRSLPLSSERVVAARDVCVEGHDKMLSAEELQQEIAAALADYQPDETIEPARRRTLDAQLDRARTLIQQARPLISRCHRQTTDLEVRYGQRARRGASD